MPGVYDTLYNWARKTTTSIGELHFVASQRQPPQRDDMENNDNGRIYRLKRWPELPSNDRTADIYRALSVMSNRPVNRHWILAHSKLRAEQVDQLLLRLIAEGAIEVLDEAKFAIAHAARPA